MGYSSLLPDPTFSSLQLTPLSRFRYKIGPEKGAILDALVRLVEPELVVELGSFVGYSAVRGRGGEGESASEGTR